MKKSLLIMALAGMSLTGVAQTEQGRIMVGAGVNFANTTTEEFNPTDGAVTDETVNTQFNFNIRGGYFLSDNFMLGLVFGMNNGTNKQTEINSATNSNITTEKNNGMSVGPFVRLYKMLGTSKFALFGQGALTYGMGNTSTTTENVTGGTTTMSERTGENNVTSVKFHPGITYFITNTIAFETYFGNVGLDFSSSTDNNNDGKPVKETKTTSLNTRLDLNLSSIWVSLNFYFGGSGGGSKSPTNP